jgi:hypothetical protein
VFGYLNGNEQMNSDYAAPTPSGEPGLQCSRTAAARSTESAA